MQNIKGHPALLQIFSTRLKQLSKEGDQYTALCPFHEDKHKGSFFIGKDKEGAWVYTCFSCGNGGDCIRFVQEYDKVNFTQATKIIEALTGGDWEENKKLAEATFQKLEVSEAKPLTKYSLDQYAKFEISLYETKEAKDWLFTERGITYDTARRLHFGYCQNLSSLNKKFSEDLVPIADKGWIIMPAVEGTDVICIEARSMVEKKFSRKSGMAGTCLFGVNEIDVSEPVYLVEGKFDQAVIIQAGFRAVSLPNATANLTPDMRDILMSASVLILAGDNDGGAGSNRMLKLHNEFQERTFRLIWPKGKKDANEVFLDLCERDIDKFKKVIDKLTLAAYANPLPGVKSLSDILLHDDSGKSEDNPDRFRFSMRAVDEMTNIAPGSVIYLSATQTSMGKTQFLLQETLFSARKNNEVVLNYQAEMSDAEIGQIVTANLLAKERGEIQKEDRIEAAKRLKNCLYYIGNNPNLNTMTEVLDLIEAGVRRVGATVVCLDHIHFICRNERDEIKAQGQAMQRIKRMAQKYQLKFFVVGQPRKPDAKTQGKEIGIYDAKGSECLVSDADVVLLLHRDVIKKMTEDTQDNLSPEVQIRCMKGRSRGKGNAMAKLFFLGKIATFREIVPIQEPVIKNNLFDY